MDPAFLHYVNAYDPGIGEVVLPDAHRRPIADPDFHHYLCLISVGKQELLIGREVIVPVGGLVGAVSAAKRV